MYAKYAAKIFYQKLFVVSSVFGAHAIMYRDRMVMPSFHRNRKKFLVFMWVKSHSIFFYVPVPPQYFPGNSFLSFFVSFSNLWQFEDDVADDENDHGKKPARNPKYPWLNWRRRPLITSVSVDEKHYTWNLKRKTPCIPDVYFQEMYDLNGERYFWTNVTRIDCRLWTSDRWWGTETDK